MTTIADGLKDVFLAGVGAMALGAEKTQELVESLIASQDRILLAGPETRSPIASSSAGRLLPSCAFVPRAAFRIISLGSSE